MYNRYNIWPLASKETYLGKISLNEFSSLASEPELNPIIINAQNSPQIPQNHQIPHKKVRYSVGRLHAAGRLI